MEETRKDKIQLIVRRFFLIITDIILINGSVMLSLLMRFNVDYLAIEPQYIALRIHVFLLLYLHLLYSGVSGCTTACGSMPV